jgi:hypothetical protein
VRHSADYEKANATQSIIVQGTCFSLLHDSANR